MPVYCCYGAFSLHLVIANGLCFKWALINLDTFKVARNVTIKTPRVFCFLKVQKFTNELSYFYFYLELNG